MRVVSNTSPIINLANVGQLDLLNQLYGEIGFASLGFRLIEYNKETKKGIVRFRRQELDKGIASFAFIKTIGNKEVRPFPLSTSGSLKKLRERI